MARISYIGVVNRVVLFINVVVFGLFPELQQRRRITGVTFTSRRASVI